MTNEPNPQYARRRDHDFDLGFVLFGIALALALLACLIWYFWITPESKTEAPCPPEIFGAVEAASKNQGGNKPNWPKIKEEWTDIVRRIDEEKLTASCQECRKLAEINRDIAAARVGGEKAIDFEKPRPDVPSVQIKAEDLLRCYPEGRTVRSRAVARVIGRGQSKDWGIRDTMEFEYLYETNSEIVVEKNDGRSLVVRFATPLVVKTVAFCDEAFERDWPDMPLVQLAWNHLEKGLPVLVAARHVAEAVEFLDPEQKKLLGTVIPRLRGQLAALRPNLGITVIEEPEAYSGCAFRVHYLMGFGVSRIELLDGTLDRRKLIEAADSACFFLDHFVFPNTKVKVGDSWSVDTANLGGLIPFTNKFRAEGNLELKYAEFDANSQLATLKVADAKVKLLGRQPRMREEFTFEVEQPGGVLEYAPRDLTLRHANLNWKATGNVAGLDHAFFPMQQLRDVRIQSQYRAELVEPGNPPRK